MRSLSPRLHRPLAEALGLGAGAVVAYLAAYVALAWLSFIHPMRGLDITPWNPQAAFAVGLLMWRPRAWWLAWLAAATSEALVGTQGLSWAALVASSGTLTAGYAATAAALRAGAGGGTPVVSRRRLVVFLAILGCGAVLASALRVTALAAFDAVPLERFATAVHRSAIGDGVGLLVTLPLLLVLGSRERRAATLAMVRSVEWWLIAVVTVAAVVAVFARPAAEQFKFFYLLFLPVVWCAARFGVTGAVWSAALVQALLVVAVQSAEYQPLTVFELQLLMAALAATGLLLGVTVDEREEAARALRASLRLAAAGDMAAALAHELNQPLTAISTYARSAQVLANRVGRADRELAAPLVDTTGKLVDEASRAGEVVRRLRNFFRDQATELQLTDLGRLLDETLAPQAARGEALQVRLSWRCEPPPPQVWLDAVQVAVVLRNLVDNAMEAAAEAQGAGAGGAWVHVQAAREGQDVVVTVTDSAAGLRGEELAQVFERRASHKPGGMGIGLAISRSIVEAHGGRLWAEPGPGGKFCFSLPLGGTATA